MAKAKWFYAGQEAMSAWLKERYGENWSCNWQDVCKDRVHENYFVKEEGKPVTTLHCVIIKTRDEQGIIRIYEPAYDGGNDIILKF